MSSRPDLVSKEELKSKVSTFLPDKPPVCTWTLSPGPSSLLQPHFLPDLVRFCCYDKLHDKRQLRRGKGCFPFMSQCR